MRYFERMLAVPLFVLPIGEIPFQNKKHFLRSALDFHVHWKIGRRQCSNLRMDNDFFDKHRNLIGNIGECRTLVLRFHIGIIDLCHIAVKR